MPTPSSATAVADTARLAASILGDAAKVPTGAAGIQFPNDRGPPAARAVRCVPGWLRALRHAWRERRHRLGLRSVLRDLSDLSDRELTDIGVTRAEIEHIAARRSLDRLRDNALRQWMH